jgi:hypothetical protein
LESDEINETFHKRAYEPKVTKIIKEDKKKKMKDIKYIDKNGDEV